MLRNFWFPELSAKKTSFFPSFFIVVLVFFALFDRMATPESTVYWLNHMFLWLIQFRLGSSSFLSFLLLAKRQIIEAWETAKKLFYFN